MDQTTLLLGWVVICGGVGALIGGLKGRVGAGFFLGAFIGPIGWLLVGLGPSMGPVCQDCKGRVPADATKCMHCGSVLRRAR